jgi:hypothetical protein
MHIVNCVIHFCEDISLISVRLHNKPGLFVCEFEVGTILVVVYFVVGVVE